MSIALRARRVLIHAINHYPMSEKDKGGDSTLIVLKKQAPFLSAVRTHGRKIEIDLFFSSL